MIKHIALTAAAVATLGVLTATPAAARPTIPVGTTPTSVQIPEPTTMLGLLVVGGSLISKKIVDDRKVSS